MRERQRKGDRLEKEESWLGWVTRTLAFAFGYGRVMDPSLIRRQATPALPLWLPLAAACPQQQQPKQASTQAGRPTSIHYRHIHHRAPTSRTQAMCTLSKVGPSFVELELQLSLQEESHCCMATF